MANLSSATVAALVGEIGDLRKALEEGTLVDQAQIAKRYDALETQGNRLQNAVEF